MAAASAGRVIVMCSNFAVDSKIEKTDTHFQETSSMKKFFANEKQTRSLLYFVVFLALLSSCAGPSSTNSPVPSETAIPASTIPSPTVTPASLPTNTPVVRVSQPGKYEGYSLPLYNERTSSSQYITMRDGTKLAALILRPAQDGKTVSTPLPVIWTHNSISSRGNI